MCIRDSSAVAGRDSGGTLTAVAAAVRRFGASHGALTPHQKLLVVGVAAERVDELEALLRPLGLSSQVSPWRRGMMACTGLEFCKLAIVDTKGRAHDLVVDLDAVSYTHLDVYKRQVLVDRLADHDARADLATLAPAARIIDVGKAPGHHRLDQGEIERLMVTHAAAGAHVVRLKGGDPYVFGRGGEEVAAAAAAGLPVTVLPLSLIHI